jgi:hypothetical protein
VHPGSDRYPLDETIEAIPLDAVVNLPSRG